jgi:murein DD-endopeptidase MepM/ murein hydrolase activator NlpD
MVGVMKTTPSPRIKRAVAAVAASSAVALGAALASGAPASAGPQHDPCWGRYGWPVAPFDRQHPVRGNYGDPRTVFDGRRQVQTVLQGGGTFSFHQGVDISAPDGSRVYPVAPGMVTFVSKHRVSVSCGSGRTFQYWHITPSVRVGQRVDTGRTVLGRIERKREHVHLTQLENGRAVDPLAPGRLTPYRDATRPDVHRIELRGVGTRSSELARAHGSVTFVAQAIDVPALSVPGRWHGFPVTPARVTWRIERGGRIVLRGVAQDGRSLPKNAQFWRTYARGTYQNWPVFHGHKAQFVTGRYLYKLTPKPLDTRRLRNGVYELVVTASDASGNSDVLSLRFTVDNGSDY